jgi:hypothetical protein
MKLENDEALIEGFEFDLFLVLFLVGQFREGSQAVRYSRVHRTWCEATMLITFTDGISS